MKISGHTLFLAGVVALVLWLGYAARAVVTPLLAALLLAYILDPVVRRLQRFGLSRQAASAITVAVAFVTLVGGATLTATRIATEGTTFYHDVVGEPACEAVTETGQTVSQEDAARVLSKDLITSGEEFVLRRTEWDKRPHWYVDQDGNLEFRPGYARTGMSKIRVWLAGSDLTAIAAERLKATEDLGNVLASSAGKWLAGIVDAGRAAKDTLFGLLTLLILFPIYLFYSLAHLAWVYDVTIEHLPAAHRDRVVSILGKVHVTLSAFFRGRLILLVIRFVVLLAAFIGFGVPFSVVCAIFASIVSLVPVVGSLVGAAVPLLLSIASGSTTGETLALAAVLVVFEMIDNYVLTPAILGKRVGLHVLTILVATFVAGDLMGIFGMLVAIPLAAVLKILAIELVLPEVRKEAGLPPRAGPGVIRGAARLAGIGHAHSERADGAVGNSSVDGHAEARARLVRAAGGDPATLVVPHQVHGARVAVVNAEHCGTVVPATDGLATNAPGVPLLVQGADCPLLLLADDAAGAVAVVHSGWRGTAARIVAEGVRVLATLGAEPERTVAVVFPGIGPCCFEVGPDVVAAFRETFGERADVWTRPGRAGTDRAHFDLAAGIRATLVDARVRDDAIETISGCTMCGSRFFSHRASRGGPGRHGLVAVVR